MKKNKYIYENITILFILLFLICYILIPSIKTFGISFLDEEKISLLHYKTFYSNKHNLTTTINTLLLGISTVGVCGVIGTSLAFLINYFKFPFKKLTQVLLLTPIMVPGVVIVLSFMQLYGESGMITKTIENIFNLNTIPFKFNGFWGILFIHAYTQYVYFFINVSVAIKHIDYSTIEAAKNLGASNFKIFKSIIYPFIKPSLLASSILTFISGISSFSAPSLIGNSFRVLTTEMLFAKSNNNMELASVQVVILTIMSLIFLYICRYYERNSSFQWPIKGTPIQEVPIKGSFKKTIFTTGVFFLILFILLPVITIFILSFVTPGTWLMEIYPKDFSRSNYIKIFTRRNTLRAFINSINMSLIAGALGVVIAVPCSYIIVKSKNKLKGVVELLTMLPWALPASAIAINLINLFNKPNMFSFYKSLTGSYILLPIAYFIGILPLILRSTNISMYNLNTTYEEASKSLGSSPIRTFKKVILPIVTPGIVSGFLLGVVRCIGEYTSSAYLFTFSNRPISIAMINAVFEYEIGLAMAYGVLTISFVIILSLISKILIKKNC